MLGCQSGGTDAHDDADNGEDTPSLVGANGTITIGGIGVDMDEDKNVPPPPLSPIASMILDDKTNLLIKNTEGNTKQNIIDDDSDENIPAPPSPPFVQYDPPSDDDQHIVYI